MSELSHQDAYRLIHKGQLTGDERVALRGHMRQCPACRSHAAAAGALGRHLVLEQSPTRPSPQFTAVYRESAARRSRRSQIMKPVYAVGGAVALALLVLAGWFIVRANPQGAILDTVPLQTITAAVPEVQVTPGIDTSAETLEEQLISAAEAGDAAVVEKLLVAGADPHVTDSAGNALLALAASDGMLDVVQMLLDAGADVDGTLTDSLAYNEAGLSRAAYNDHIDVVRLLINHGADINRSETLYGRTALHGASWTNNADIVELLLENGADPNFRSTWGSGETALHFAVRNGSIEAAQVLLANGAEVDIQTDLDVSPMMAAIKDHARDLPGIVSLLLEKGADPNLQDNVGNTALHIAARMGMNDIIPMLIEHGASLDLQTTKGNTALHEAAKWDQAGVVSIMIQYGADVNLQNNEGQTPLDVAANDEIAEMLREAGADEAPAEPAAASEGYSLLETIPSPSLSGAIFGSDEELVAIYLPASYDGSDKQYPVLYILGSLSDFFLEGAEVQSESLGWKMNAALGGGPSQEMIIVVPDGYNSVEWGRAVSDGPVNGNVLAFIAEDVVNYVDASYRTIPEPASRGLLGLDIGGHDALNLVLHYPDRFGAIYLNHPWLLAPGGLEESRFAGPVARTRIIEFVDELSALSRAEAQARLIEILEENPFMYEAGLAMTYGWDYAADAALNAPYFEYLYLDEDTPASEGVWQLWEAGTGNLDRKVADNADSLKSLRAIGMSEALNDQTEPWTADGIHYLAEQLEANEIPFQMNTYEGTIEDVYEQLKNPILPFFSKNLVFEE